MPTDDLRPLLARDGIFNTRDLGGLPAGGGLVVRPRAVVRADALQRCGPASAAALRDHGVRRVLDLRDDTERKDEGVFEGPGIEVLHLPVLDPAYRWDGEDLAPADVLPHRYAEILMAFAPRFVAALEAIAEGTNADGTSAAGTAVAYHCAVGKDRTGLLTALLLGALGSSREVIVADYARSARVGALQVQWLWTFGHPAGQVSEDELAEGVWSARPATMEATLDRLRDDHGGVLGYLHDAGLDDEVLDTLRARLLTDQAGSAAE